MRFYQKKITVVHIRKPHNENINQELQWFGNSLGLFNLRDKDKSCFRIFIELLKASKIKRPFSSDELAYRLNLSRGTVVHHINKLIQAGLVIHEGNKYLLRVDNLKDLVEEIEKDLLRSCNDLRSIADKIDARLGL